MRCLYNTPVGLEVMCSVSQQSKAMEIFFYSCVHRDTWDALVPTSSGLAGAASHDSWGCMCIACRTESRHQKLSQTLGLATSEVQMCVFILSPEGPCKYTAALQYL